jgi:hypothetical protein
MATLRKTFRLGCCIFISEVTHWVGHTPERLKQMKHHLERLKTPGVEAID